MVPLLHEHIVRPWGIMQTPGGTAVLLTPYTAGSLSQLLRSCGVLTAGQTVTALTPIALALEHLHRRGAAHGDVTAANVLLAPDGRPALSDLGDTVLLGMAAPAGSPAGDVQALARVAWQCLTGRLPEEPRNRPPLGAICPETTETLAELLEEALSPLAEDRPTAGELASELYACASAEPLELLPHVDDEALAEVPTRLPASTRREHRPRGLRGRAHRLARRLWGPSRRRTPTMSAH